MITRIFKLWRYLVELFSSEWILTRLKIPNGGPVIALRSLISSSLLFLLTLAFLNFIDPSRTLEFSFYELKHQTIERFAIFGVIFAGMYTALYARFSSQWTYLAGLYNKIKEIEVSLHATIDKQSLSEWKAGFIEDADNLHIACKGTFVTIIRTWGNDKSVKKAFIEYTPGGKSRYEEIIDRANESIEIVENKFNNSKWRKDKKIIGMAKEGD